MKRFKKTLSLIFAAVMLVSMTVGANAATTVTKPDGDNHTYSVYQIMTGEVSGDTITNGKWGANSTKTVGEGVPKADLDIIAATVGKTNREILDVIEGYVNFSSTEFATVDAAGNISVDLPAGYYIVVDTTDLDPADGEADSLNTYVVKVTDGDTLEIVEKRDVPTLEKTVMQNDTVDSTGLSTANEYGDLADYSFGDTIPFKLKATLPSNFADYKTYVMSFVDSMEGMQYKDGMTLEVYDASEGTTYVVAESDYTGVPSAGDTEFTVALSNLRDGVTLEDGTVLELAADDYFVLTYNAEFNAEAKVNEANPNTAYLEYSSNPNAEDGGDLEDTPEEEVVVFTYKLTIEKVDNVGDPLSGVTFNIQNKDTGKYAVVENGKVTSWVDDEADATVLTTDSQGLIAIEGLDEGTYTITELETNDGFVMIDPFDVTISAGMEEDPASLYALSSYVVTSTDTDNVSVTVESDLSNATLEITNIPTSSLPSTGGMGRKIFYIVGGVLILLALVCVATRKVRKRD